MKPFAFIVLISVTSLLSGCTGYPRLLNFPFDPGGRSLNSFASELTPQISSRFIVFVSDRNGSQDVYLYDAQIRQLVNLPGLNSLDEVTSHPSISEDGRYIVFQASRQGRTGIFIYDRQTEQKRNLTASLPAEVRNPTISADGTKIAFEVAKDGQWDILVYDRSGQQIAP
ncbi:TolB family protein [Gloeothece verrucosa]|uniref:Periplasmic component of the Tol biopolymer transport system-like protein n=1 Tax=Gloeothece verrucosa (strain PCC 7822) TaxID=497965 RepID=E0U7H4_GLOV7|nr:TolB family protein [Gloeothece verrucosa]ADN13670.1 periplasmic component of the Tol biopolymer transport system-like protein [Gloeothece verrucosa PCC 7822]